jgi:hypothetical protein
MVPGIQRALKGIEEAKKLAKEMGYPVLLKAAAGGGGKGMRVVEAEKVLISNPGLRIPQTGPLTHDGIEDCALAQIEWFRPYKDVPFVIHTERLSARETARELVSNETLPIEMLGFDSFYDGRALRIVNSSPPMCLNQMAYEGLDLNPYIRESLTGILTNVSEESFSLLKEEEMPLVVIGDGIIVAALAYAFAKTYSRWLDTIIEVVPPPVSGILVVPNESPGVRRLVNPPVTAS